MQNKSFSVVKQAKTALLTWADGVKVADRRDRTRNLSLRKRCTNHCTTGPPVSGNFHGFIAWVVRTAKMRGQKRAKSTEMQRVSKHTDSSLSAWFTYVVQNQTMVLVPKRGPVQRVSR